LITLPLIGSVTPGAAQMLGASPSWAPPTWNDSPDPGMKLEMRPPVEPPELSPSGPPFESAPATDSAPAALPAPASPPTSTAAAARSAPTEPAKRGNPLWAVPLSVLHNTRDRPLFSSSRRPPPPADVAPPPVVAAAPPPPPPPKPAKPDLSLVGTIVSDQDSIGVFLEAGTDKVLRLRTGEGHQGWVLRAVDARKATLDNDTTSAILILPTPGSDPQDAIPSPYARGTRRVHH
jgi:general secretion pathway protein N